MLRFHCYANSDAHYKLRVRGRGTNLFAEKKKKALARLAEKKLHGEEKKKQVPGEEEAVPGEKKKLCSGREEESVFRERRRICSKKSLPEITFAFFIILF